MSDVVLLVFWLIAVYWAWVWFTVLIDEKSRR